MGISPTTLNQTPAAGSADQANAVVSGAFAATGQSATMVFWGPFNVILYGNAGPNGAWAGTVRLERTFDGGTTWVVCGIGGAGSQAAWSTGTDVSVVVGEPEKGVGYRLNCTVFTSGPINYRMSGTGAAELTLSVASVI